MDIPETSITGGLLLPKDGSGTMMAVPMYVEINSGVKQFELRYTAATLLENADLTIQIPNELLGALDVDDDALTRTAARS